MAPRPRAVLDTNVLLSALVFGGKLRLVTDLLARGLLDAIICEEILTEMRRNVSAKFPDFAGDLQRLEILLEQDAELVKLGALTITVCRDPDDNRVIEAAVVGECGYIISGDKDLLILGRHENITILRPDQFLKLITL